MKLVEKIVNNKLLKIIYNILYYMLVALVLLILLIVIIQRVSNNTISLGGFRVFNVVSESMMPKYEIGDVLLSKAKESNEIEVGDDVVYEGKEGSFSGRIVTHQVIEKNKNQETGTYTFKTKGLANTEEDPEINEDQICGVVIYKIKTLSFISKIVNNLYSFYFLIFIPIVILIFIEIRRTISSMKSKE